MDWLQAVVLLLLAILALVLNPAAADTKITPLGATKGRRLRQAAAAGGCPTPVDYDVCVVGAGGSGMYAAWRLQQAQNRSVLVLEKKDEVGGNCDTFYYNTPIGNSSVTIPIETGVILYINTSLVAQTLRLLNISARPTGITAGSAYSWSRSGGYQFKNFTREQLVDALKAWITIWDRDFGPYDTLSTTGQMPDFTIMPTYVRNRLLMPFSQYLDQLSPTERAAISPLLLVMATDINIGYGSYLDTPAYWVAMGVTPAVLKPNVNSSDSTTDGFYIASGCSALYNAMAAALGPDRVILSAAFNVTRQRNFVRVAVSKGTKWATSAPFSGTVTCRRLLISATPTLENLGTFMDLDKELDTKERTILSQVTHSALSTHLVTTTPVLQGSGHVFEDALYVDMPALNAAVVIPFPAAALVQGFTTNLEPPYTVEQGLQKMYENATFWGTQTNTFTMPPYPTGAIYSDVHAYYPRFKLPVSTRPYLYKLLYSLQVPQQPYKNTLYTGHMFSFDGQHYVWQYSETLVNTANWVC